MRKLFGEEVCNALICDEVSQGPRDLIIVLFVDSIEGLNRECCGRVSAIGGQKEVIDSKTEVSISNGAASGGEPTYEYVASSS